MKPIFGKNRNSRNQRHELETSRTEIKTAPANESSLPQQPWDSYQSCPSFDAEPWKSRAAALRPKMFDPAIIDLNTNVAWTAPLPESHPYVRLVLEFLETVPTECWIDEENDVD